MPDVLTAGMDRRRERSPEAEFISDSIAPDKPKQKRSARSPDENDRDTGNGRTARGPGTRGNAPSTRRGSKPAKGATEPHERCRAQGEVGCFTTPGQAAKVRTASSGTPRWEGKNSAAHDSRRTPVADKATRRGRPADDPHNRSFAGRTEDAFGTAPPLFRERRLKTQNRDCARKSALRRHTPRIVF